MLIYIPTRDRWTRQVTWNSLPPALQKKTLLVTEADQKVPPECQKAFEKAGTRVLVRKDKRKGIAAARQWILENSDDKYVMMIDDDCRFSMRTPALRVLTSTPQQVTEMFTTLEGWLKSGFTHCGITHRSLNWTQPYETKYIENSRMMHVLAYNRDKVVKAGCSFTKGVAEDFGMDDFHMTLQLLKAGHGNRVSVLYSIGTAASNAPGGASGWRTVQTINKSSQRLVQLHAPYAKLREKKNWKGIDGEQQLDVTVQWRKAYDDSQKLPKVRRTAGAVR